LDTRIRAAVSQGTQVPGGSAWQPAHYAGLPKRRCAAKSQSAWRPRRSHGFGGVTSLSATVRGESREPSDDGVEVAVDLASQLEGAAPAREVVVVGECMARSPSSRACGHGRVRPCYSKPRPGAKIRDVRIDHRPPGSVLAAAVTVAVRLAPLAKTCLRDPATRAARHRWQRLAPPFREGGAAILAAGVQGAAVTRARRPPVGHDFAQSMKSWARSRARVGRPPVTPAAPRPARVALFGRGRLDSARSAGARGLASRRTGVEVVNGFAAVGCAVVLVVGRTQAAPAAALEQPLSAADGVAGDQFGQSVAVEGDTAVVGAPFADGARGAVYVFARAGDGWTQTAKLTASDGAVRDRLGSSVAIAGDTIVAGAPLAALGANPSRGAVYTFAATGPEARTETAKLTASDGAGGDHLGSSVAVAGDTIVAGAPGATVGGNAAQGAVYTFAATGPGARSETAKLTASDGARFDDLGFSVAVAGDTIVAGAPGATVGGNSSRGAVYTFAATGAGARTETAKLIASDGAAIDRLGWSVAVAGDTIVAGAPRACGGNPVQGAAYTFAVAGAAARTQTAKLTASDGARGDRLGTSVAAAGDTTVAGAPIARVGANARPGAAYTFAVTGPAARTETAKLTASEGAAGDECGVSVAASGDTIVVGAPLADVGANPDQGFVSVFFSAAPPPPPGPGPASPAAGPAAGPSGAEAGAAAPVGAPGARASLSALRIVPRCVRRSPSGRVRARLGMRLTPPGPVHIQIDRALATRPRHRCTQPRGAPHFTGRFRPVATLARVATRPAPRGRRRVTLTCAWPPACTASPFAPTSTTTTSQAPTGAICACPTDRPTPRQAGSRRRRHRRSPGGWSGRCRTGTARPAAAFSSARRASWGHRAPRRRLRCGDDQVRSSRSLVAGVAPFAPLRRAPSPDGDALQGQAHLRRDEPRRVVLVLRPDVAHDDERAIALDRPTRLLGRCLERRSVHPQFELLGQRHFERLGPRRMVALRHVPSVRPSPAHVLRCGRG
jgi:hypothetical protein